MPRIGPATRSFAAPITRRAAVTAPTSVLPSINNTSTTAAQPVVRSAPTFSQAPTALYRQHHDVTAPQVDTTAFRQGWLVQTRLYSLFESGRIERDGLDAALTWRRWAGLVSGLKAQSWEIRVDQSVAPGRGDNGMSRRIDAAAKLRAVVEALGPLRVAILEACVLMDRSWTELGRLLRASDKTAKDRTVEAITALTACLAGDPVPPMPEIRFRNQPGSW